MCPCDVESVTKWRSWWPCVLKAYVCNRLVAGITGSDSAEGMRVYLFMFVVCCVDSGISDRLISRLEESFCECVCVVLTVCDLETSTLRLPGFGLGCCVTERKCSSDFHEIRCRICLGKVVEQS